MQALFIDTVYLSSVVDAFFNERSVCRHSNRDGLCPASRCHIPSLLYRYEADYSWSNPRNNLEIDGRGKLMTKLFDKRDDFSFCFVNVPFICMWQHEIPSSSVYRVFISQLIRFAELVVTMQIFLYCILLLTNRILGQGYIATRLKSLQMFYDHHGFVDR